MALYLISYDIAEEDAFEYDKLYKKLKQLGAKRILESEWAQVDKIGQATEIYDSIVAFFEKKDRLLVQELGKDAVWDNLLISDADFQLLLKNARF